MALQISVNEFTKNIQWYRFVSATKPVLVTSIPIINAALLASGSFMSIFPGDAVTLGFAGTANLVFNYSFSFGTQPTGKIRIGQKVTGVGTEDVNDFDPQQLTGSIILFSPDSRDQTRVVNNTNTIMQLDLEVGPGEQVASPGGGGGAVMVSNWDDMIIAYNNSYLRDLSTGIAVDRICGPNP